MKEQVKVEFLSLMRRTDEAKINGLMKLWIYQHYILSKLAWPFLIHDFNLDFATKLQQNANVYLKRWAGVLKGADAGVLSSQTASRAWSDFIEHSVEKDTNYQMSYMSN